jgi:uncharacterized heparinase superfamily protein
MQNSSPEPSVGSWHWSRLGLGLNTRAAVGRTLSAVDRARCQMLAYLTRSPLPSWPSRPWAAEEDVLLAPPDLRVPDPSFVDELRFGNFGLAGEIAASLGRSPFAVRPVSEDWARELHGFGWLRHLDAARSPQTEVVARRLVQDWLQLGSRQKLYAWAPEVAGRRLMSWLAHSALLLDGTEPRFYAGVVRSLRRQANYLAATWRSAPEGYAKLCALIGLVSGDLCLAGRERRLARSERLLATEIERQVFPDGGHIGRNPETCAELVLDLLPLRQCFLVRGLTPSPVLQRALERMVLMLRHLRLGDGSLARFNGVGATDRDRLATVLAYDKGEAGLPALAPQSRYARLARGATIVLVDVGPPPPVSVAHGAHAGCLSFELSVGEEPLFVNNGAPAASGVSLRAAARATASHNTVCLKEQSSSKLVRSAAQRGALPIAEPNRVTCSLSEPDGGLLLQAEHDGYVGRCGLLHSRTLYLDAAGEKLKGSDCLQPVKGVLRFAWDVPFAVHFHVHPDVEVWPRREPNCADLVLSCGAHWRLCATGAALTIEPSLHNTGSLGSRPAQQLVLRAACHGEAKVTWELERLPPGQEPKGSEAVEEMLARSLSERLAQASIAAPETVGALVPLPAPQ